MPDLNLIEQCNTPIVAPALSDEAAENLARVLKAVADPMRIKILHRLASAAPENVCVCDLTEPLGLTQPTVSHHLRVLMRRAFSTAAMRAASSTTRFARTR